MSGNRERTSLAASHLLPSLRRPGPILALLEIHPGALPNDERLARGAMGPAFGGVMSNHVAEQLFPGSQVPRPSAGGGDLSEGDPTIASRPADAA